MERARGGQRRAPAREQPEEGQLARQPRLVVGAAEEPRPHVPLIGSRAPADKPSVTDRILIVDDHPLTRDALAALLERHEFRVVGRAGDGEEAIAAARSLQPDLVLLDLSMPGLDGLAALPRIRLAAPGSEVVVLTASGTEANLMSAIRGGA